MMTQEQEEALLEQVNKTLKDLEDQMTVMLSAITAVQAKVKELETGVSNAATPSSGPAVPMAPLPGPTVPANTSPPASASPVSPAGSSPGPAIPANSPAAPTPAPAPGPVAPADTRPAPNPITDADLFKIPVPQESEAQEELLTTDSVRVILTGIAAKLPAQTRNSALTEILKTHGGVDTVSALPPASFEAVVAAAKALESQAQEAS